MFQFQALRFSHPASGTTFIFGKIINNMILKGFETLHMCAQLCLTL